MKHETIEWINEQRVFNKWIKTVSGYMIANEELIHETTKEMHLKKRRQEDNEILCISGMYMHKISFSSVYVCHSKAANINFWVLTVP